MCVSHLKSILEKGKRKTMLTRRLRSGSQNDFSSFWKCIISLKKMKLIFINKILTCFQMMEIFTLILLTFHNSIKRKNNCEKTINSTQYPVLLFYVGISTIITLEQMDLYSVHVVNIMLSSNYLCLIFFHIHLVFIQKCP